MVPNGEIEHTCIDAFPASTAGTHRRRCRVSTACYLLLLPVSSHDVDRHLQSSLSTQRSSRYIMIRLLS